MTNDENGNRTVEMNPKQTICNRIRLIWRFRCWRYAKFSMQNSSAESLALHVNRTSVPLAVWNVCGGQSWVISIQFMRRTRRMLSYFCYWTMWSVGGGIVWPSETVIKENLVRNAAFRLEFGWLSVCWFVFTAFFSQTKRFSVGLCASLNMLWLIKIVVDDYLLNGKTRNVKPIEWGTKATKKERRNM